jgi:hypothetical protein
MPSHAIVQSIQKSLDEFALGSLNVARNRVTLPPECGGLGLFKLDEFLTAQQCTWVLRADKSLRDNWWGDLFCISNGNCLSLSHRNIDPNSNPVLHCLGLAFEKLRICHDSTKENFLKATPLYNPLIFRGPRDKAILDPVYLDCEDDLPNCRKIANLKMEDCFGVNGLLTRVEIRQTAVLTFQ